MPRFKLVIEYDGTAYAGWQRQREERTVQGAIEQAACAFSGEAVKIRGAGRTDAGVHAIHQVAHADLAKAWRTDTIRDALNAYLREAGDSIAILSAAIADDQFDARMSARKRHYLYRIINRRSPLTIELNRAWHVIRKLDLPAMNAAAAFLVGKHDFTTFRAAECQAKSPVKTVDLLKIDVGAGAIEIRATARSFLHHQIRSFAGSLVEVGAGKWQPEDVRAALDARDRTRCGPMAPACGLYLIGVDYLESPGK